MNNVITACVKNLEEISGFLRRIQSSPEQAALFSEFIGPHVRHVLEHYTIFLNGILNGGPICYDQRLRNHKISDNPEAAIAEIETVIGGLKAIILYDDDPDDGFIEVEFQALYYSSSYDKMRSTKIREIYFLLHHTIHHCALIFDYCEKNNIWTPFNFGKSPATIRFTLTQAQ